MNKNLLLIFVVFLSFLFLSCANNDVKDEKSNEPKIVVSLLPQQYIITHLLPNADVKVLIPSGMSPEMFEPSPAQMVNLSQADLFFSFELFDFEKEWKRKINKQSKKTKTINLTNNLSLIKNGNFPDPHVWTSPILMKDIAKIARDELSLAYPTIADEIENNYKILINKIENTHKNIAKMLAPYSGKSFIIFHPALNYYANTYHLNQISIEKDGKESSVNNITDAIHSAKSKNIKGIFVQKQFDKKIAKTLSKELDIPIITINPLSEKWEENMLDITNKLIERVI